MDTHVDKYRIKRDVLVRINAKSQIILHPAMFHGSTTVGDTQYHYYLPIYEGKNVDIDNTSMGILLYVPLTNHVSIEVVVSKNDVQKAVDDLFPNE